MSTAAGAPSNGKDTGGINSPERQNKGKGKNPVTSPDVSMEGDEDEEDDSDGDGGEEMDEDDSEEDSEEEEDDVNPSAILSSGRRTRGLKVDYTSAEALRKAGLKPENDEEEEEEEEEKQTYD